MNITLHIERVILEGLPVAGEEGALLQQAMELELTRLLNTGEFQAAWQPRGDVHRLQTHGIQVVRDTTPARLGEQIAARVHGGLFE